VPEVSRQVTNTICYYQPQIALQRYAKTAQPSHRRSTRTTNASSALVRAGDSPLSLSDDDKFEDTATKPRRTKITALGTGARKQTYRRDDVDCIKEAFTDPAFSVVCGIIAWSWPCLTKDGLLPCHDFNKNWRTPIVPAATNTLCADGTTKRQMCIPLRFH
jgi:hypothetical protein